jgi:hypothetical protein
MKAAVASVALVAALVGAVLVTLGATPDTPQRHAVAGHFDVAHPHQPKPVAGDTPNLIANASFETGSINDGWYQCGDVEAYTTTEHPYDGGYAEYSGTRSGIGEPLGNSGICQLVTIPPGGVLTARLYQLSNEPDTSFAYQEGDLIDARGNTVVNLYKSVNNRAGWVLAKWALTAYAGRTLWLYFGVHGDGYQKFSTQQFVDDVKVTGVSSPAPK